MESFGNMGVISHSDGENQLHMKPNSKYLQEVIDQANTDHDAAIQFLERKRKALDGVDSAFLENISLAVGEMTQRHIEERPDATDAIARTEHPAAQVDALLDAAGMLIEFYQKARSSISEVAETTQGPLAFRARREEDQRYLQALLEAGKHVAEMECGAVEQTANAREFLAEREALAAQAMAVFGGSEKSVSVGGRDPLNYVQKGVKKMTKALLEQES